MVNIGDIFETDGKQYKVVDVKTVNYDDGSMAIVVTSEPM